MSDRQTTVPEGPDPGEENRGRLWRLANHVDASVLRMPRFFGLLYGRIQDGLPLPVMWERAMARRLPANVGWRHAFGGITFVLFLILIVTGVLLSFYYRPSVEEAYGSISFIEADVSFGWLMRHLHFWSANLIVLLAVAHLCRSVISAAYEPPRQTNWIVGILLLAVVLGFAMTGYLLPWDLWSYWASAEHLEAIGALPLAGPAVVEVLRADEVVAGATLSRFFALHVILFPWLSFALLGMHFQLVRKQGIAGTPAGEATGEPFYPNHMLRQLIAVFLTIGVVMTLALLYPPLLSGPATAEGPAGEVPVLSFTIAAVLAAGEVPVLGLLVLPLLFLMLALLPWVDRLPGTRELHRRLALGATALFVVVLLVLGVAGRRMPPPVSVRGEEVVVGEVAGSGGARGSELGEAASPAESAETDDDAGEAGESRGEEIAPEEASPSREGRRP